MRASPLSHAVLLLALAASASSCGLFSRNLAKRHRNLSEAVYQANTSGSASDFVEIRLTSSLVQPDESAKVVYSLLSLTPQGQEQLIKSIDGKVSGIKPFIDQLTTNFSFDKEKKPNVKIIGNKLSQSLVFTVDRKVAILDPKTKTVTFNNKADRIDFLELRVNLAAGTKAVFNSWDKFTTKFATLNLGSVTQSQDFSASLNLNASANAQTTVAGSKATEDFNSNTQTAVMSMAGPSGTNTATNTATSALQTTGKTNGMGATTTQGTVGIGGSGNLTYSDKYETSLDLRSRIVDISGSLADDKIILRQEGGPGQDLSGNQTVLLDYTLTDDWAVARFTKYTALYNAASAPKPIAQLANEHLTVLFPNLTANVTGTLSYQFLYRQVNKGNRHIPEARQKVTYRYGEVGFNAPPIPVTLIKLSDVRPKAYELVASAGASTSLLINGVRVSFESALEAESFLHYLGALLEINGDLTHATLNGVGLTTATFPSLTVKTTQL